MIIAAHAWPLDFGGPVTRPFEPFPSNAIDEPVGKRFVAIARAHADRLAAVDDDRSWTYGQLLEVVNGVATAVRSATVNRPGPIAVLLPHDARFPAAVIGVLTAGRGCVPLDASHPIERNQLIVGNAGAAAMITARAAKGASHIVSGAVPVLDFDALARRPVAPETTITSDALACIVYTSGSTGTPKGVYQNHRGLLHDVMQSVNSAHMSCEDRVALFYSPSIIAGLRTSLSALLTGASVHVLPPAMLGPAGLVRQVQDRKLTMIRSSPGLFRYMVDALAPGERLQSVRMVLLGGDRVEWDDVDVFKRGCTPGAVLGVHLGATECWTLHTQWYVDESVRGSSSRLPVGRSIPDRPVTLVDDDGRAVTDGDIGECVVSSRYLALGYWRDPERTARAFVTDSVDPTIRSYRTGDLAFRRSDGLLEYVGRKDQQIKLAGRRIEPGEIESAVKTCGGVRDAALIVRRNESGEARSLVVYVELHQPFRGLLERHLKTLVARRLPQHMVPSNVVVLDALPRLPSFKIDRKQLETLDAGRADGHNERARAPLVDQVARVFESVLGVTGALADDTLSSLGGDSLQAILVVNALERRFSVSMAADRVFAAESIRHIAGRVGPQKSKTTAASSPAERGGDGDSSRTRSKGLQTFGMDDILADRAVALDLLLRAGDVEGARGKAARLHAEFADVTYAKNLCEILARVPSPTDAYLPLGDDDQSEIQLVERYGAETLLLLFCGRQHTLGVPSQLIHRWLGQVPATLAYIRDWRRVNFLAGLSCFGTNRESTVVALRELRQRLGATRVACIGNSAGTIAALQYGLELRAEAVLCFGGQVDFSAEFNAFLRTNRHTAALQAEYANDIIDVRQAYSRADRAPTAVMMFGEYNWDDRLQAECLHELPSVSLLPVTNYHGHHIAAEVIRRGHLEALLAWSLNPSSASPPSVI